MSGCDAKNTVFRERKSKANSRSIGTINYTVRKVSSEHNLATETYTTKDWHSEDCSNTWEKLQFIPVLK